MPKMVPTMVAIVFMKEERENMGNVWRVGG